MQGAGVLAMSRVEYNIETGKTEIQPDEPTNYIPPTIEELRISMQLSKADAKLKLLAIGLYTEFNAEIQAMDDCKLKILWNNAEIFHRLDANVDSFLTQKGFTPEQIDGLFI